MTETAVLSPPERPLRPLLPTPVPVVPALPPPRPIIPAPDIRWFNGSPYVIEAGLWRDEDGELWKPITVTTTAYTWVDDLGSPAVVEPGRTATHQDAKRTYGVATDWRVLPRGTVLRIPGYGDAVVDDKCGKARREWRTNRDIIVDLRIPNRRYDGLWRSNQEIRNIAFRHGIREDRTILRKVE